MPGNLLDLIPWLILGIPLVSAVKWLNLRGKKKTNYAHFIEWREFPVQRIFAAKIALFLSVGIGSLLIPVSHTNTIIALLAIGTLGYLVEETFVMGRPLPTPGYVAKGTCQNCRLAAHEKCSNLRMLDGFETHFLGEGGQRWPVCCCGFRLGEWKEVEP